MSTTQSDDTELREKLAIKIQLLTSCTFKKGKCPVCNLQANEILFLFNLYATKRAIEARLDELNGMVKFENTFNLTPSISKRISSLQVTLEKES